MRAVVQQAHGAWSQWKKAGLIAYSPNLAPVIHQPDRLRQQMAPKTYQVWSTVLDGQRTLRDLALKLNQDEVALAQTLVPYLNPGVIHLAAPRLSEKTIASAQLKPEPALPHVVCIDDSPHICRSLEQILTPHYRFTAITDPLQAVPMLLKINPELIFLDLIMPVANGYEICAQIRRVTALKDTPVIVLTGNDGLVDRVRTRWVGSTEFLPKPINASQVLRLVNRYLATGKVTSSPVIRTAVG